MRILSAMDNLKSRTPFRVVGKSSKIREVECVAPNTQLAPTPLGCWSLKFASGAMLARHA